MAGIPHQSRLAAFEQEITDLRRRRPPTPYRQVLRLLRQKHGIQISLHALYSFVQVRKKWERIHRSAGECLAGPTERPSQVSTSIKPATTVPVSAKAVPAHPVTAAPQPGNAPPPRKNPGERTLKSFTPSAEYNLERLTPEQMAEWLAELKRNKEDKTMSCTLIFTAGAKGGSGKTTAARLLITYLQEKGTSPLILDLDDENHTLSRFFPEAVQIGIQPEFAHDVLIEKAISQEHGIIVADLKAGTGHEVLKWFLELPFSELKRRGVEFVCVGSITSAPDSVQSFLNWAASLDDHVRYLVFRNLKDGEQLFDHDQTRQAPEFRGTYDPDHVTLEKLSPLYQTELEIRKLIIAEVLGSPITLSAGNRSEQSCPRC